jgi:uracil-DNA glycosylase family 4
MGAVSGAKVGPRGPASARIMCVGEAPGANEERLGQPFVGPAGNLLTEMLGAVGIDPERDVWYTNICKYRPPGNEIRAFFDSKGMPNDVVVQGMRELELEITRVQPNVIVPLGNYPTAVLTGRLRWKDGFTGIGNYRGSILPGNAIAGGRKCIPTYHPASILREYSNKPIAKLDLAKAALQSSFPEIRRASKHLALDPRGIAREQWAEWLRAPSGEPIGKFVHGAGPQPAIGDLRSSGFLTADIEYIGSKLLCVGLTRHADVAVSFAILNEDDLQFIRNILLSGIPTCWQNGMFDCSVLEWHLGIECVKYMQHDTMLAMHAAYTEYPKDLGFIGSIFTDQPYWKDMIDWHAVREGSQPLEEVLHYNAIDTWVTHAAMESMLADELTDPAVRNTYNFEISLVDPLWKISKRGVRIDIEKMKMLQSQLEREADDLQAALFILNDRKPVNPKSPPQCAQFIYEQLGVKARGGKTPAGAWQMDDETLAELELRCPDTDVGRRQRTGISIVRKARERLDLISKFCEIDLDDDGRMRCHYDPAKTQTGRLSSRKFYPTDRGTNLQNVPRDTRVRAVFVPDDGYIFGYADLKSAESLCVAHITGDPEMLRLHSDEFMSGERDGHRYVASFLFDKPMEAIDKDERYLGKRIRHAGNYALGYITAMNKINADAQKTGVSIDRAQAKAFIAKYRQMHPMLEVWWRQVEAELWRTRTIHTMPIRCEIDGELVWFSRPHTFYDRVDSIVPEAIAFNPQGTVANVLNVGVQRADGDPELDFYGFQPLLQVHDAIGFQVPRSNWIDACKHLQSLMGVQILCTRKGVEAYEFSIPVDIKGGWNWGEREKGKNGEWINPMGLRDWQDESLLRMEAV